MRSHRLLRLPAAVAASTLALAAPLVAAPAASADSEVALPNNDLAQLLVDDEHGHVYVSGGGEVSVVRLDGALQQALDAPGAVGLEVVGDSLYVARCGSSTIDRYDATTLMKIEDVPVGATIGNGCDLASAGGRLWVGVQTTPSSWIASVGLDPAHSLGPAVRLDFVSNPRLFSSSVSDQLVVVDSTDVATVDAASDAPTPAEHSFTRSLYAATLSPDGGMFYASDWGAVTEFRLADWSQTWLHPLGGVDFADAVATSADGSYVAMAGRRLATAYEQFVSVVDRATGTARLDEILPSDRFQHAVGVAADGEALFVARFSPSEVPRLVLRRVDDPFKVSSRVALDYPTSALSAGASRSLTGRLTFVDGSSAEGQSVALTTQRTGGAMIPLGTVETDADGWFSLLLEPILGGGSYTVTARYGGDPGHRPASGSRSLTIAKLTSTLSLTASKTSLTYGQTLRLTAHLGGYHTNDRILFFQDLPRDKLLATVPIGANGLATLWVRPPRGAKYYARFAGDDWYTADLTARVVVRVSFDVHGRMVGGYESRAGYRLFRYSAQCRTTGRGCPVYSVRVEPAGRHELRVRAELKLNGAWRRAFDHPVRANRKGVYATVLVYTPAIKGVPARMRAVVPRDDGYETATTDWTYFKVTR
jgi:hypothetical protein